MKNLSLTYIIALTIIAVVIGFSQLLVQRSISTVTYDSRTINISGRQTMLSQKITKAALAIETAEDEDEYNFWQQQLKESSKLWEASHNALQYGNDAMKLDNVNNSEKTFLLFLELEPHYSTIRSAVKKILTIPYQINQSENSVHPLVDRILGNEDDYLRLMNEITFDYDDESSQRLANLSKTEYVLLAIALILLITEALLIFRPAIKRIKDYTRQLIKKEKSLQQSLNQTKIEKAKVDYLNTQAKTVFQNVNQGIFLLDDQYTVSELHSKALENILMEKNIGGTNFVHLLRPRLVQRDLEALEMFIKHLYNPDIEEEVLHQLNPVAQVEIFSNYSGENIESRFLKFSFSRIGTNERIYNILVTVDDETQSVKLQRQIQESEERNKRESEQLLSILRVDPFVLKDFLESTDSALQNISQQYENNTSKDLKPLLNFTFSTIHNLKGNALLIDLELMADKFHQIEETIEGLQTKKELVGNDFLRILYEMDEIMKIVINMNKMLEKIVEVNRKMEAAKSPVNSNDMLISSLEKGIAKLCKSTGKEVSLDFQENEVIIPELYKVTIKDILIQLIRNSFAHGLESRQERLEMGKDTTGQISISLSEEKDKKLEIHYQDDGRGLNLDRIFSKALELNLLLPDQFKSLSDIEKANLIFMDGFSTAESVDQNAGRGQGMSFVKSTIEKHGGEHVITSTKANQFKLSITLPLVNQQKLEQVI